ncbi:hypothetical protein TIFTF001_018114 [Ficus carica]|uniref:C2H2-type domain-containing protein n=1 Tax=Ficus carica TaxID=3494 RepID=A0AA88ABV1_FICCA|nr:hypothetical protein TIFTF001_018114 [Ficus carica]
MAESDSKSSSDETDRSDQNDEYSGLGRSYECTFCKRGFTTAQALGGHMNIHRKDRGKPRPDHKLVVENIRNNNYSSFRSFPIQSYPPVHFARSSSAPQNHQVHLDYQTYVHPATITNWGSPIAKPSVHDSQIDLLRENWIGTALSLGLGMSHHEEEEEEEEEEDHHHHDKEKMSGGDRHVEVDLELRLGYDP